MKAAAAPSEPTRIIILGALSAIADAAAREWVRRGPVRFMLAGRDRGRLEAVSADLRLRGAGVLTWAGDLSTADAEEALASMVKQLGGVDVVVLAYGVLGDQASLERSPLEVQRLLATNFTSAAGWCLAAANHLEQQGRGSLVVIGSVAGDRGRASNYVYGAAKGGLGILVQGLAHRLAHTGARAVLIKPGYVDTPMTAHVARKGLLWARPETLGRTIVTTASACGSSKPVIYAPGFWRGIMAVIRLVPARALHKTRL